MSGQKIIDGLKDAVVGNFARVTIDGQVWVRLDNNPVYRAASDMLAALNASRLYVETLEKHLNPATDPSTPIIREHATMVRAAIAKATGGA